jgi:ATPase family associated with various cellular activities (AAA)
MNTGLRSFFTQHTLTMHSMRPSMLLFASFMGLQLVDVFSQQLVSIGSVLKTNVFKYIQSKTKAIEDSKYITPNPSASIEFYRDYSNTDENQVYIDSILNHLSELNSVIRLQRRKIYLVNSFKPFDITPDIKGRIKSINMKDNQISEVWFELYSYTISLTDIRGWIDGIYEIYKTDMQTGFGKHRYFFNHQSSHMDMNISNYIAFDMTKFYTNKSLTNLFGSHIDQVRERLGMFQDNKSWYDEKGIPYTFGLLLHGLPGCGKTSLIKAIAKDTNRHILNIKLTDNVTLTQLRNLFYSEKLKVTSHQATPYYITIPIDQRIYVMEDVDCLTNILNQRMGSGGNNTDDTMTEEDLKNIKVLGKERWLQLKNLNNDTITLSDILNIIDGVLETPGRILILTSNYPDKLDTALLRPGRIDFILNFKECDSEQLKEMFNHFYSRELDYDYTSISGIYVPAYVQEIFLRHLTDPGCAYDHLIDNKSDYSSRKFIFSTEGGSSNVQLLDNTTDSGIRSTSKSSLMNHRGSDASANKTIVSDITFGNYSRLEEQLINDIALHNQSLL